MHVGRRQAKDEGASVRFGRCEIRGCTAMALGNALEEGIGDDARRQGRARGGGIYLDPGSQRAYLTDVTLTDCTVWSKTSYALGGGLSLRQATAATVEGGRIARCSSLLPCAFCMPRVGACACPKTEA